VEGHGSSAVPEDRLSLSRDLDLLADRFAVQGDARRAHELKLVAAMLRDKAARPAAPAPSTPPDPAPDLRNPLDDYLLAASLIVSWLIVVLWRLPAWAPGPGGDPGQTDGPRRTWGSPPSSVRRRPPKMTCTTPITATSAPKNLIKAPSPQTRVAMPRTTRATPRAANT
jgi:hypothetical protein